jgi:TPR repeat protein
MAIVMQSCISVESLKNRFRQLAGIFKDRGAVKRGDATSAIALLINPCYYELTPSDSDAVMDQQEAILTLLVGVTLFIVWIITLNYRDSNHRLSTCFFCGKYIPYNKKKDLFWYKCEGKNFAVCSNCAKEN